MDRTNTVYEFVGVTVLDYYDLYRKFTFTTQESYKLGHIGFVELGEGKISFENFGSITDFYRQDFQKFMEYNVRDVDIVVGLENKLRLIELALGLAYSARCNLGDVFSQVRMWDTIIYNYLLQRKIVIPPRMRSEKDEQFEGAYVKDPQIGQHEWVVVFDLDSLYPMLLSMGNFSPETLVSNRLSSFAVNDLIKVGNSPDLEAFLSMKKAENLCVAANGTTYRKDIRGFLPELIDTMYAQRKQDKQTMLEAKRRFKSLSIDASDEEREELNNKISKYSVRQITKKVCLNSVYGSLGNQYFRYYDLDLAEAVTMSGQLAIRWIETHLNQFLNKICKTTEEDYVIASDTDSVMVRMSKLVALINPDKSQKKTVDFLDKSCKELLLPFIAKKYDELAKRMNAYENKMSMKRETISSKGIWTAKKRYMLAVHKGEDDVYMEKPELKITGIETARSSTPQVVRKHLKEAIRIIMVEDETALRASVQKFKDVFMALPPEQVAFPRGCNGMDEYADYSGIYKKATPIAVKGALIYNHWIHKKKLDKKYPLVRNGDKVKFVYLKMPNPVREKVIAFTTIIPEELCLKDHVDYDTQFEKTFIDPLTTITNTIGWKLEEITTLEDLFS
jgi:DNA polymerase elongation subunit (family B)